MLKLRGCPKCQGALNLASDMYGRYISCLQCGFSRDLPDVLPQARVAVSAAPEVQASEVQEPMRKAA